LPALAAGGLRCGEEFFLAFSPERENPGDAEHTTRTIPKVVGGVDDVSGDLAAGLYGAVVELVVRVSSPRVAEASKLTENIFRGVNIALVNELKRIYDRMGIDVWEVLDAAATKPFGFMRFTPGPGWGGHCIPVDPFYLSWKARQHGEEARFIELAGTINTEMPAWVVRKLGEALLARGRQLHGARVLVLGLAYKPNVDDPRESPAFEILDLLLQAGAVPSYHDPHVAVAPPMRSWPDLPTLRSVALDAAELQRHDAAIVVTAHEGIDWKLVAEESPLVVDTRGVYREVRENVVKA
jgi:UDP-N-acetyl-D-glucosamine dehydrogenase